MQHYYARPSIVAPTALVNSQPRLRFQWPAVVKEMHPRLALSARPPRVQSDRRMRTPQTTTSCPAWCFGSDLRTQVLMVQTTCLSRAVSISALNFWASQRPSIVSVQSVRTVSSPTARARTSAGSSEGGRVARGEPRPLGKFQR